MTLAAGPVTIIAITHGNRSRSSYYYIYPPPPRTYLEIPLGSLLFMFLLRSFRIFTEHSLFFSFL